MRTVQNDMYADAQLFTGVLAVALPVIVVTLAIDPRVGMLTTAAALGIATLSFVLA